MELNEEEIEKFKCVSDIGLNVKEMTKSNGWSIMLEIWNDEIISLDNQINITLINKDEIFACVLKKRAILSLIERVNSIIEEGQEAENYLSNMN